jgi:hypothetical protein
MAKQSQMSDRQLLALMAASLYPHVNHVSMNMTREQAAVQTAQKILNETDRTLEQDQN